MKIQLLFNGNIIHERDLKEMKDFLVIGRSSNCDLVTPREDNMISSAHAELFRKGKAVWLRDKNSTNHTFYRGKPIREIKLAPGMELILGHCVLLVQAKENEQKTKQKLPARLVVGSGSAKGREVILGDADVRIGTSNECELQLDDRTVSRLHAVVHMRSDETCWIADHGSLNGTRVNGDRLPPEKERLLRGGDEITVGDMIVSFMPAGAEPSAFHAGRVAVVLIATLLLGVGAYWGYKVYAYPSAEVLLEQARLAAAQAEFGAAEHILTRAEFSYDYKKHYKNIRHLCSLLLPLWQDTFQQWNKARKLMTDGDFETAAKIIGMISTKPANAWTWSPDSHQLRTECLLANDIIQCYYLLLHHQANAELELSYIAGNLQRCQACLARSAEVAPPYLQALLEEARKYTDAQQSSLQEWSQLWNGVEKLHWDPAGMDGQLTEIEKGLANHEMSWPPATALPGFLAPREGLRKAIATFRERYNELLAVLSLIKERKFSEVDAKAEQLIASLTGQDRPVFSIDRRFVELGNNLHHSAKNALIVMRQYRVRQDAFQVSLSKGENLLAGPNSFADPMVQRELFQADCLKLPFGQRHDTSFHRLLGMDAFYNFLKGYETQFPADTGIYQLQKLLNDTDALLHFFSASNNENITWLYNLIRADIKKIEQRVLLQRDIIIGQYLDRYELSQGREKVTAGGVALALATDSCSDELKKRIKSCQGEIMKNCNEIDVALSTLDKEVAYANPERQVEIIMKIMDIGIPGHPIVRKIWPKRDAVQ